MDQEKQSAIVSGMRWVSTWTRQRKTHTMLIIVGCMLLITLATLGYDGVRVLHDRGKLVVYALDVGQGDALFIRFPNGTTMLIDGGPDGSVVEQLGGVLPFWERHIDTMVLTHPQADHVGGLPSVFERYSIGRVVMTGVLHTTPEYLELLQQIRDTSTPTTIVDHPFVEAIGSVRLQYLWPRTSIAKRSVPELNNASIILRMVYGDTSFLFIGDSESSVEDALIAANVSREATVLKVGHHGSDTSTSEIFLDAVHPRFAMISVGRKNKFGHPSRRILRRLERAGVEVHRTDKEGRIRFVSDGTHVVQ
ncbi:MAG: MBL fold metallo-hydrolase [Candidatus Yonathbacteria bacterium]|nr:MBL fold metallo-hydrolase [Candidatus Yonathbacteria bacterium]